MMKMVKRHGFSFLEAPANRTGEVVVAEAPRGASELAGFLGTSVERIMDVSTRAAAIEDEQEIAAQMQNGECRLQIGGRGVLTTDDTDFSDDGPRKNTPSDAEAMEGRDFREDVAGVDGTAMGLGATGKNGKRGARRRRGAAARRRKYDPAVWGGLAFLSDEEPQPGKFEHEITEGTEVGGRDMVDPQIAPIIADFRTGDQKVVEQIQERVCGLFGISKGQLVGETGTRRGRAFAGRVASMALCRAHTRLTLGEIGAAHERCEHGAVSRATRRAAELREADGKFAELYAAIEAEFGMGGLEAAA